MLLFLMLSFIFTFQSASAMRLPPYSQNKPPSQLSAVSIVDQLEAACEREIEYQARLIRDLSSENQRLIRKVKKLATELQKERKKSAAKHELLTLQAQQIQDYQKLMTRQGNYAGALEVKNSALEKKIKALENQLVVSHRKKRPSSAILSRRNKPPLTISIPKRS